MPDEDIPPPPPSPPQPPLHPARGHSPVHEHLSPHPQPHHHHPHHHEHAGAMFGEQKERKQPQQQQQAPSPAMLDARLPRTPDGKIAALYVRILFTVQDPPAGHRRTWARAQAQALGGDSQEGLRKTVQTEEKQSKLSGRKWLTMKGMTPEKRRQIEGALAHHQRGDQDPRFEWLPGMIKLRTEKDGDQTFTRSMDVIIKRVPSAVIIQPSRPAHAQPHPHMYPHPAHAAHHGAGHPNFAGARAAAMAAMAAAAGAGGGIEVLEEDIVDMGKKKDKGDKDDKKKKKPEVHNNKPKVYTYSTAESDSDMDSLFSDSDADTPHSSVSGDPRRRRRSSVHKHSHSRRTSETHGLREHKHRSPPREREPRPESRPHNSRRGSTSSYGYEAQLAREEETRRFHEQELRLARAEGMLQGMSLGDRRPSAAPRLQIDERSQYPAYPRSPRYAARPYYR